MRYGVLKMVLLPRHLEYFVKPPELVE